MAKICDATGYTPADVADMPPPLARIRELEQENTFLIKENERLRRRLSEHSIVNSESENIPDPDPQSHSQPRPSAVSAFVDRTRDIAEQRDKEFRHAQGCSNDPYFQVCRFFEFSAYLTFF